MTARRSLALLSAAAIIGVVATASPAQAAVTAKSGGYGAYLSFHHINAGPFGTVHYPEGPMNASILDTNHDLLDFGTASGQAGGSSDGSTAWATATVQKIGINLLNLNPGYPGQAGLPDLLGLKIDAATASCTALGSRGTGTSRLAGVTMTLAGTKYTIPANPLPNTYVGLPGVIDVWFNKQVRDPDGTLHVTAVSIESSTLYEAVVQGNLDAVGASVTCGANGNLAVPGSMTMS